ncbi:MAG TPA: response regulator, partial [bacterium]|nr:response regulator [bacterium]
MNDNRHDRESAGSERPVVSGTPYLHEYKGHVLVVDDDEWNCELLSQGLSLEGLTCAVACNGQRALEMVQQHSFDLVLLDIAMPRMSGLQVLEILRKSYTLTELPVIMVTAQEGSEFVAEALRLGANDYVTKPLDMVVLLARTQSLLTLGRLERRLREEKYLVDSVINSAHEMIISVDMNRRITVFNRAAERNFGYSREEVLHQHIDMLYADPNKGMEVHRQSVRENGFAGEVLNRRRNGEEFVSGLSVSVLFDQQGNPTGLMGISTDITERKKLELERENLGRLKDEFLRIASHDLKNPVAAIYGLSRVLQGFVPPGTEMTQE